MKPKKSFKKYVTKGYRRIRYNKGHGVHSPFAFSLITQVINESMNYYAYDKIRKLLYPSYNIRFSTKGISLKKNISTKKLFLIYRLINKFSPQYVLQIGLDSILSYTLGVGRTDSILYSLCDDKQKIDNTIMFFKEYVPNYDTDKYRFINSKTITEVENLKEIPTFDFIYIHKDEGINDLEELKYILAKTNKKSVIMIEGIKNNEITKAYWNYLRSLENVRVTMDLYDFGLAIFDDKLYKHHYIVSY